LLGSLSISAHLCLNASKALDQFSQVGIDLMVVDWDEDTADLLSGVQKSDRWHKPTVVAISPCDYPVSGAHVVLDKPVTEESGAISLRVSIEARVRWTRNYGTAGCEYLHIPPTDLGILDDWLKSKTHVKKPFVVM